ncbi:FHA domain-containing protein [Undibacterium sp. RTI2.1]|uniref:FHA domain-containing protein n=1 Tax=unclassified Undibacterium TaxID=2630295 RepID=UPI002AB514EA|nr:MULTISPECIES: FHA domain-containing protein [unclassified Undibacterium]MDY7538773.1 FHA domain-containing protein [Undibacterium sp. 5I1]MEB0032311.1 FHA domain-containing protein [Undibacterium sp. RTI2.1]MEB0118240.1 FHA domain-containing protein [Undibacterium sp. RTI2.2]MEB0229712.1 FHA domain-containing protein [Undibacterium sp. 10I3]MEB0258423.1 FHA domain-containing protein [Undibacterium sp. 5I1]
MAKIVVTFNGLVQQELSILKSRITVGRRPGNDVVIDHLTVSGQHAAIDTTSTGSFVLDLGSTNGTLVNGQPIKKHLLQNDDIIDIGKYKVRYQNDSENYDLPDAALKIKPSSLSVSTVSARIQVQNGANAGRELVLNKPVTTIGSPTVQVIAITQQEQSFYVAHVDGASSPKLNNKIIDKQPQKLADGDVIDMSGTKLIFVITSKNK